MLEIQRVAKKPPPTELTADVGAVAVTGNTSTSTVSATERYIRRIVPWEFKQDLGAVYGKTGGVESSNLLRVGLRADTISRTISRCTDKTVFDRNRVAEELFGGGSSSGSSRVHCSPASIRWGW